MRVLALDTTTRAGSVAVVDDRGVIVERGGDVARSHAERLPADLIDALAAAQLTTADVDLFAVACGPGSFTGLRIGIAAVQGLAFVHRRLVAPVSALRALAELAAAGCPAGCHVAGVMDAHRGDLFTALYRVERTAAGPLAVAELTEIEGPVVSSPARTVERWTVLGTPSVVCGDGASAYGAALSDQVAVTPLVPLAGVIGRLGRATAAAGAAVTPGAVQPLYVRRPDAELAREARARQS